MVASLKKDFVLLNLEEFNCFLHWSRCKTDILKIHTHPCNVTWWTAGGARPSLLWELGRRFTQHASVGSDPSFTQTLEEMGTRIDDLEKNVVELMLQAGMKEQEIAKQWLKIWGHSCPYMNFDLQPLRRSLDVYQQMPKNLYKAEKPDVYSDAANSSRSLRTLHFLQFLGLFSTSFAIFSLCSSFWEMDDKSPMELVVSWTNCQLQNTKMC